MRPRPPSLRSSRSCHSSGGRGAELITAHAYGGAATAHASSLGCAQSFALSAVKAALATAQKAQAVHAQWPPPLWRIPNLGTPCIRVVTRGGGGGGGGARSHKLGAEV